MYFSRPWNRFGLVGVSTAGQMQKVSGKKQMHPLWKCYFFPHTPTHDAVAQARHEFSKDEFAEILTTQLAS